MRLLIFSSALIPFLNDRGRFWHLVCMNYELISYDEPLVTCGTDKKVTTNIYTFKLPINISLAAIPAGASKSRCRTM